MNPIRKNPLGRGLESLIPRTSEPVKDDGRLIDIDITEIIPNDEQPRKDFDQDSLQALTDSIKSKGVMQPIVVTKIPDGRYMLISGERRWRATALAGLRNIPAVLIPNPVQNDRLELALIENTQRDDLKPLELAKAYKTLMERCSYRQEDVARIAGRSRSGVANTLRLLDLPDNVHAALEQKLISEGHARVFLSLDEEKCTLLLNEVIKKGLSVRDTEALARKLQKGEEPIKKYEIDPDREYLRSEMESFFGVKVNMKGNLGKGTIEIKYSSVDELDRIVKKLRGEIC